MNVMNKYEVFVEGQNTPLYLQAHGVDINPSGVATFYDVDGQGDKEVVYSFSPSYWNQIKLVE